MSLSLIAAACLASPGVPEPVLWMRLDGSIRVSDDFQGRTGSALMPYARPARLREGTAVVRVPGGVGYDFDGKFSGVSLSDIPTLAFTDSFSVSCWIKLRSYVDRGPGAQIFFRGDDRAGLDPYQLTVHRDGTIHFGITNEDNVPVSMGRPIALDRWTHVVASLDAKEDVLLLWLDGKLAASSTAKSVRPLARLDPASTPGVGIGNVQNVGRHNQPLNGTIADLKVFNRIVTPEMLKFNPKGWNEP